jgi:hypothetical protein
MNDKKLYDNGTPARFQTCSIDPFSGHSKRSAYRVDEKETTLRFAYLVLTLFEDLA